jgi:cell division protein FtsN
VAYGGDAPLTSPSGFFLQAGAFFQPENADALARRLRDSGFTSVRVTPSPDNTGPLRVRLGPYAHSEAMLEDQQRLRDLGISGNIVKE